MQYIDVGKMYLDVEQERVQNPASHIFGKTIICKIESRSNFRSQHLNVVKLIQNSKKQIYLYHLEGLVYCNNVTLSIFQIK